MGDPIDFIFRALLLLRLVFSVFAHFLIQLIHLLRRKHALQAGPGVLLYNLQFLPLLIEDGFDFVSFYLKIAPTFDLCSALRPSSLLMRSSPFLLSDDAASFCWAWPAVGPKRRPKANRILVSFLFIMIP